MKAIVFDKKASPDKLLYRDVEKPIPGDNEILVAIKVVSPNAADYRSIKMNMIPKKKIFGSGIAGIVESVGKNIQKFESGDQVIGDLADFGFGGFAEFAIAPEKTLVHKPGKITFEEAAILPVASTTALQALRDKGQIKKQQKVLIVGSSGGVGSFAVQLAKYFEAVVTAVCSTNNMEQSRALGADYVIDYTRENFTKTNKTYDLIIAINGNYPLLACKKILNRNGKYVMVGGSFPQIFKALLLGRLFSLGSKKILSLSAKPNAADLKIIANLMEEGKLKPFIEGRYSLMETAKVIKNLSQGHAKGKVVIKVNEV